MTKDQEKHNDQIEAPCPEIKRIIYSQKKDLGGFSVRRVLPFRKQRMVGPWIFFDHMGPAQFDETSGLDVRPHPHINLATVTYLFEGQIHHRDSLGTQQSIRPGDINLMVAGAGITHSERELPQRKRLKRTLNGLQLWLALPEQHEEMPPAFYHYPAQEIPSVEIEGVPVRVLIGSAYGQLSPVKTYAKTLYLEARLKAGQSLILPSCQERGLYIVSGQCKISQNIINPSDMAVLNDQENLKVTAIKDSFLALVGGEKVPPRYIFWNFVSSRKERLEKAKKDWVTGMFPLVPGDEKEFIPLPDEQ